MASLAVFVVWLRRPSKNDPRTDPFYELGSFGLTGCHGHNLLYPPSAKRRLSGARLAFVQGGKDGVRLICLTPPVNVVSHSPHRAEAYWNAKAYRYLKYSHAPIVTDIPELAEMIHAVDRKTAQAKFASKFRSRAKPLPSVVAEALEKKYIKACRSKDGWASRYEETLPILLSATVVERFRKKRRNELLRKAQAAGPWKTGRRRKRSSCGGRSNCRSVGERPGGCPPVVPRN